MRRTTAIGLRRGAEAVVLWLALTVLLSLLSRKARSNHHTTSPAGDTGHNPAPVEHP